MQLQLYDIKPKLAPYVKSICTMECDEDADTSHVRVLPDACVEIFLNYTNPPVAVIDGQLYTRSIVTFRMNRYADVRMRKGSGCVALCFYPGMAQHFFKVPMSELANTTTPLSDLWKLNSDMLEEQLALCSSALEKVNILQNYLITQLTGSKTDAVFVYCMKHIEHAKGNLSAGDISGLSGLSQRQLSRKFGHNLGLPPKEYLRVTRFIYSLRQLKYYPNHSLTELAHRSGYYDQAHFIRDYKEFTGCTPGVLVRSDHILY
ncbi:AraC family transcriptional regulator [Pedobacter deserti]|uniref:AraC family transcriptional regulator n=1 Tax=Pedobacter deserti TaxID=2817382 RepID=UPI00210E3490|nr:helix-turn-helix domain-containing protein [Pedobacter sp. SYSU D00382]